MSDFLGMSDEDFLKLNSPPPEDVAEEVATPVSETPAAEEMAPAIDEAQAGGEEVVEPEAQTEAPATTTSSTEVNPLADGTPATDVLADPASKPEIATKDGEQKDPDAKPAAATTETKPAAAAPDYAAFYAKVMTPFKANGKMVELKTPEEAIQLMQMGANYTRKMQDIVPHRKVLMMLESNGLLDEGKLGFLIDIEKKNPEAIKKLIKESGLDPMEIDVSSEPAYREGNHRVSDAEASFRTALDELKSNQSGVQTIQVISSEWDQASKDELLTQPAIMGVIHQQREIGIYDRIATEVNRQKTLGLISAETPFLRAYKAVGDKLAEANAFADLVGSPIAAATPVAAPPAVVATRVAAPKPAVTNNDKASAASSTRTAAPKAQVAVNYLAMSDDEFLKQLAGRV